MRSQLLLFAACALLASPFRGAAVDCVTTLPVRDGGWYNDEGFHDPLNLNFFAGYQASSQLEFRNWLIFDLPTLEGTVVAAELRLYTFAIRTTNSSETIELHDVTTPTSTLTNGGAGLVSVFDDLAEGALYARTTVFVTQANTFVSVPLNSNALALINSSGGQPFALGGRVATLPGVPPYPTNDTQLYGFSSASGDFVQLKLFVSSTHPPKLVVQPPAMVFAPSGGTAILNVEACGATPFGYQWFFNNSPLIGQIGPRLSIFNVTSNHAGNYYAVVTNLFGATTSSLARLFLNVQPAAISSPPANTVIHVGGNAELIAGVQGAPVPAVSWTFNGTLIPGATSDRLVIANAQFSNAGTYTITASNFVGSESRSATLAVEPLLINGPSHAVVDSGNDVILGVSVSSASPSTFQWRRNGTNIAGGHASYLPLYEITSARAGSYDVIVANSTGTRTSQVAQVIVVNTPPALSEPGNRSIPFGTTLPLTVTVAGSQPMRLQWYRDGAAIPGATNASYFIERASASHAGFYRVVASNAFGVSTSATANVAVIGQAPIISMPTEYFPYIQSFTGDAQLITGSVQGGPPPALQWKIENVNVPGATNASFFWPPLPVAKWNFLQLVATNAHGTNVSDLFLDVAARRGLDRWTWRNPLPQGNDLNHVALAPGRSVAVGKTGSIVSSSNGLDWISVPLASVAHLRAVTARESLFAALTEGVRSGEFLFLSLDGLNWFPQHIPGFTSVTALEFIGEELHAFGLSGGNIQHAVSTDGVTWTSTLARGLGSAPHSIAFGQGLMVVAGAGWTARSADGTNFMERSQPDGGFKRVRFVKDRFMGVASAGTLWQSTNGHQWIPQTIAGDLELKGVAYGNGRIVVVGLGGLVRTSLDGLTWESTDAGTTNSLNDIRFDGAQFIVCGNGGVLLASGNGLDWTSARKGHQADLFGIVYTNELFVAVGAQGAILTSSDAANWTARDSSTSADLHAIVNAAGIFVAIGRNGTVVTSADGTSWTNRATPTTNDLRRIAWGGGRFVAVGSRGTLITSINGRDWVSAAPPAIPGHTELEDVTYGESAFVAVGGYAGPKAVSVILRSKNGLDWTSLPNVDFGAILRGTAVLSGNFVEDFFYAVGDESIAATSTNGIDWQSEVLLDPGDELRRVVALGRRLITLSGAGRISSRDNLGFQFPRHRSIVSGTLHDLALGRGTAVAVGDNGVIVESAEVIPRLSRPQLRDGLFQFTVSGGMSPYYSILASDNLAEWEFEGSARDSGDGEGVLFFAPTNRARRFFWVLP